VVYRDEIGVERMHRTRIADLEAENWDLGQQLADAHAFIDSLEVVKCGAHQLVFSF